MSGSPRTDRPLPSLLAVTARRGILAGRLYLGLGVAISLILTVVLLRTAHASTAFLTVFPLEIPLFASLGGMGGLLIFTSDRSKGVLEYLISYGIRPGRLFVDSLVVTLILSTIVLGASLAVGVGGYLALGHPMTSGLEDAILGYTIPMAYASALFASVMGIVWSSLSTPRMGLNSPVGVAPILGIAPPILVLVLAESVARASYYYVTVGTSAGFLTLVVILVVFSSRLMDRERYLSPM